MFETLEARRLMSAAMMKFADGITAQQGGSGSLSIKGGSKASGGMAINVIENGISQTSNGVQIGLGNVLVQDLVTGQEFVFYGVKAGKAVKIDGTKSGDTINFDGTSVVGDITGNDGNDMITIQDRGAGGTKVDGGKGDDVIAVVYSKNASITGGSGNDVILLNTAASQGTPNDYAHSNIVVNAGNGDDMIITYAGHSTVDGGGGNDSFTDASSGMATYMLKNVESTQII